jgi:glycolate oxidase FAD binding subunit
VLRELRTQLGEANVLTGDAAAPFALGDRPPLAATFPTTVDGVREVVTLALEHDLSVLSWGGGTDLLPSLQPASLMVGTQRLNRLIDYQPDDLTVTVEAGMTFAVLTQILAERRQVLPLEPPLPDRATVGGVVAGNTTGPGRCAYGTPRDWVIGIEVVGGEGAVIKGGGRVVKNVAGYDLCKLYTGSRGTLGAIVQVSFKLFPRPEAVGTVLVGVDGAERAEQLLAQVVASELAPAAVELLNAPAWSAFPEAPLVPERPLVLVARFEGPSEAVSWQTHELRRIAGEAGAGPVALVPEPRREPFWAVVRDLPAHSAALGLKAAVPTSMLAGYLAAAEAEAARHQLGLTATAHALNGIAHLMVRGPAGIRERRIALLQFLRERATALGGSVIVRQSEPLPAEQVWGPPRPDWPLMQRIKAALDPKHIFNPGGFVDGI